MKKNILILLFFITNFIYGNDVTKERMRELIAQIRLQAGANKYLITQNGSDIYFNDEEIDPKFLTLVDAAAQESLFYGVNGVNEKTPEEEKRTLKKNLTAIRKNNKMVFSVNYTNRRSYRRGLKDNLDRLNFIGEAIPTYNANRIFNTINNYNTRDVNSLKSVKNFLYLLNPEKFKTKREYLNALRNTNYDMLIIEPSVNGKFFTKDEVSQLKRKKNGGKRIVIAYFSIGEAEDYRTYWKKSWNTNKPKWVVKENPNWKGNYIIEYWNPEWKKIIRNYQRKLDSIGVDGYYLDTIDTFEFFD